MLEVKLVLMSRSESLLGIFFDQGEYEKGDSKWRPFTRFRFGFIFATLDIMYHHK